MLKARLISAAAALLVAGLALAAAFALPKNHAAVMNRAAVSVAVKVSSSSAPVTDYYLKEYEGKIGVYYGKSTPNQVLDVYINTLPQEDQGMLEKGIHVKTYDELLELIENYTS